MGNNIDLSVLILSCDKNKDVLKFSLEMMGKFWVQDIYNIYVGLEEEFLEDSKYRILNYKSEFWTKRILHYLNVIPNKYVLIFLDDFVLEKETQDEIIQNANDVFLKDEKAANVSFASYIGDKIDFNNKFYLRKRKSKSLLNWQVGIWDKDKLINLLSETESPWESEILGSYRAEKLTDYNFYCIKEEYPNWPFVYNRGWLIVGGIWNQQEVKRLQNVLKIKINLGNREIKNVSEIKRKSIIKRLRNKISIYYQYYLIRRRQIK